jgi:peptidoglycan/LPS O-acetylase OafA/YrhL
VFFTLSGYLITDILLRQVAGGGIQFKNFWLARARRLLPALFAMLLIVIAWTTLFGPHQPPDFRTAALSAAGYFNNWWLIFHDVSYFAKFEAPGPLNHLWSLSIEEQFYIVWPFILLIGLKLFPEAGAAQGVRPRLARVTLALAIASGVLMAVLYNPGIDPSRVYYGTDTRAVELLVGAALAMVWPSDRLRPRIRPSARRTIDMAGGLGLAVIAVMILRSDEFSPFLYRGGFFVLSIATALAVAALAHPASKLAPVVGCRPMRWIGERSYGIYLWHFPIIVLTTPEGADAPGLLRGLLQLAATIGVAAISWKYLENPARHGAIKAAVLAVWDGSWRQRTAGWPKRSAMAASAAVVAVAIAGLFGVGAAAETTGPGEITLAETVTSEDKGKEKIPCQSVIHIGDSTSEGLVSSAYLPNEKQLIGNQYARGGAKTVHLEVSGARSIYERFQGLPNAQDVAEAWRADGFDGCWVLAMGTNEAANVGAGSAVGFAERIDSMMQVAGDDPVLWVNVKSLVTSGPYSAFNMEDWDQALLKACDDYPNMRIFDWASIVKDEWFIDDGIHFTTPGYAARSRLIAKALFDAFPPGWDEAAIAAAESDEPTEPDEDSSCLVGAE